MAKGLSPSHGSCQPASSVAQRVGRFQAQRRTGRSSGSTRISMLRDARGPPDEAGAFEGEHHLMHAGWRDLEVPLHVGFRGRLVEDWLQA